MYAGAATQQRPVNERDIGTPVAQGRGLGRGRDASDVVALLHPQQRLDARSDHRMRDHQQNLGLFQPRYSTPHRSVPRPRQAP